MLFSSLSELDAGVAEGEVESEFEETASCVLIGREFAETSCIELANLTRHVIFD
jgi:hypothetical protein